jgi:hypothetical protein
VRGDLAGIEHADLASRQLDSEGKPIEVPADHSDSFEVLTVKGEPWPDRSPPCFEQPDGLGPGGLVG